MPFLYSATVRYFPKLIFIIEYEYTIFYCIYLNYFQIIFKISRKQKDILSLTFLVMPLDSIKP